MRLKVLAAAMVANGTLRVYKGVPHGMCTTRKNQVNADLLPPSSTQP
jgi:non-heme chloroperoxidase